MTSRILAAGLCGLLGATALATVARAQAVPPTPTAAQAAAADTRQGRYVTVNGAQIFFQVAGTGTPLLLIHGFPLSGELFHGQLAGLSGQFQVITPDLRGFGKSTTPSAYGSIEQYASDILAFMNALGIQRAVIGGHSMGGQITLQLYHEAPQRFLGMLLIDTNPMAASLIEQAEWPGVGRQAQTDGVPSIVSTIEPQMLTGTVRMGNPALAAEMADILAEGSVDGVVGGAAALAGRPDFTAMLHAITVPTLVLVGLDDPIYSYEVSTMTHNAIPFSKLAIVPRAEHASIFERPALANAAIAQWATAARIGQ